MNYSPLAEHARDSTKDVGNACITDPKASGGGSLDALLEAELASFATLLPTSRRTPNPEEVIPGQLDLLDSLDPADTTNSQEQP